MRYQPEQYGLNLEKLLSEFGAFLVRRLLGKTANRGCNLSSHGFAAWRFVTDRDQMHRIVPAEIDDALFILPDEGFLRQIDAHGLRAQHHGCATLR